MDKIENIGDVFNAIDNSNYTITGFSDEQYEQLNECKDWCRLWFDGMPMCYKLDMTTAIEKFDKVLYRINLDGALNAYWDVTDTEFNIVESLKLVGIVNNDRGM